jgi:OmpA-OmpF porin, OOP family
MKRTLLSALLVAAGTLSSAAMAQGYIGVGLGQSSVKVDCSGTLTCDKTDTASKLFGGYMFSPNFGVEAAYYNQGKVRATIDDGDGGTIAAAFKGDGVGLYALAVAPFDRASVFAKVGAVSANVKGTAFSATAGSGSVSERHTGFGWGIGAGYEFSKNLGGRFEWERVRVEFAGDKFNADLVTLGLLYRF